MRSSHFAERVRATSYSADGLQWRNIDPSINVLGSRYALVIRDLHRESFELPLARTRVAVGRSAGRRGDMYVAGRVDKACLEVTAKYPLPEPFKFDADAEKIGLVATLVEPYAVFLKN
jgi:hypothetical protein